MKRDENVEDILRNDLPSASSTEAESAGVRILERLQMNSDAMPDAALTTFNPDGANRRPMYLLAAAAIVLAVLIPITMRDSPLATLEVAGKNVHNGELIESKIYGEVVKLEDGSRIEMRKDSVLVLERADDGVRIRLDQGDIVVNAAKQHGHLYVQTNDVMVSVIGTVFYVKATREGSRVAVFEGEVQVKQGQQERKLGPGEQARSNPRMESLPLEEEVLWSREAASHIARLFQAPPSAATMAFEEVTIRPAAASQPLAAGARGGGDGRPPLYGGREWCHPGNDEIQLDPRRWAVKNVRLFTLIAWAYGRCTTLSGFDRISGGPEWVKSDKWDIQALIPEGSNDPLPRGLYGAENEFVEGRSPKVQEMLKALLADRFKLALRHETKEVPVYVMSTTSDGPKFQGNQLFEGRGRPAPTDEFYRSQTSQEGVVTLTFINSPLASLVEALEMFSVDRPVLDRTGIGDKHTFRITWERDPASLAAPRSQRPPTPFRDLLKAFEQVGLQLQERKEPIDVIVIQHAEKPLEN